MHFIIFKNQNTFIPDRLITDNIMITHEVLHIMKQNKKGKFGIMALKLDMSNTYDKVEWSYLEVAMKALGFNEQ